MVRSNIHRTHDLVKKAGRSFEEIAFIDYARQLVYIITKALVQEDLDRYTDVLRECKVGSWIQKSQDNRESFVSCPGDRSLTVPKIIVSNGMQNPGSEIHLYAGSRVAQDNLSEDYGPEETKLAYILVIQGQTGDSKCKLVVETSLDGATSAMMYEALNGYSTVFSAAMLKSDLAKLRNQAYALKAVQDRKSLRTVDGSQDCQCIGFWC
jgi:hypothetical protein